MSTADTDFEGLLLVKPPEAFEYLGVSYERGYQMIKSGELPSLKLGRCRRIPVKALRAVRSSLEAAERRPRALLVGDVRVKPVRPRGPNGPPDGRWYWQGVVYKGQRGGARTLWSGWGTREEAAAAAADAAEQAGLVELPAPAEGAPPPLTDPPPRWVYFIQVGVDGPVKIGLSRNVKGRMRSLQTAHPQRLTLLGAVDGDAELEAALHAKLAAHRLSGEWFAPHPDVMAEVPRG